MRINYLNNRGEFELEKADESSYLYFPICNEVGVMNCITPILHGDSKINQNSFLLEPVSCENLQSTNMGRNVWFRINKTKVWALNGTSPSQRLAKVEDSKEKDKVIVTAGKLWHKVSRTNKEIGRAHV